MTGSTKAALAASLLALAACGGGSAGNDSVNAEAAANQSGEANGAAAAEAPKPAGNASDGNAAAAASASGGSATLSRDYLVGRWTEMDDCEGAATEFRADGSFLFPWGDTGSWTLTGNRLRLSSNTDELQLRVIDRNTLEVTSPSRTYRSTRC